MKSAIAFLAALFVVVTATGCKRATDSARPPSYDEVISEQKALVVAALSNRVPKASNGIYAITTQKEVQVLPIQIRKVDLLALNNENTQFLVSLETTRFSKDLVGKMFLFVENHAYHIPSGGLVGNGGDTDYNRMWPTINDPEGYGIIAKAFPSVTSLRKNPGHAFAARFFPKKKSYVVGEPVLVGAEIKNTGNVAFTFYPGEVWHLVVTRDDGKPVEPCTDSYAVFMRTHGGMYPIKYLHTGQVQELSHNLQWDFDFSRPGVYEIHATYPMEVKPESDGAVGENADEPLPWDDVAKGTFSIVIEERRP